jgi:hypothetical protein
MRHVSSIGFLLFAALLVSASCDAPTPYRQAEPTAEDPSGLTTGGPIDDGDGAGSTTGGVTTGAGSTTGVTTGGGSLTRGSTGGATTGITGGQGTTTTTTTGTTTGSPTTGGTTSVTTGGTTSVTTGGTTSVTTGGTTSVTTGTTTGAGTTGSTTGDGTTGMTTGQTTGGTTGDGTSGTTTGGGGNGKDCTAATATPTTNVSISDLGGFMPSCVLVSQGATVTFSNTSLLADHSIEGGGIEKGTLNPSDSLQRTFARPGAVDIHCGEHKAERVTIIVQ